MGRRWTICGNYVSGRGIRSSHWGIIGGNKVESSWKLRGIRSSHWWEEGRQFVEIMWRDVELGALIGG